MRKTSTLLLDLSLGAVLGVAVVSLLGLTLLPEFGAVKVVEILTAFGGLLTGVSAVAAFLVYAATVRRHSEEDARKASDSFMTEAARGMERAYETFTRLGDSPPRNDRLLWLSTARMLIRSQQLGTSVFVPEHRAALDQQEDYWRLRFYSLLVENKDALTEAYFMRADDPRRASIARNSIAAIFAFAKWKEGVLDPMEQIDDKDLFAEGVVPIDFFGVRNFLERDQEYWAEVQRRREAYETAARTQ